MNDNPNEKKQLDCVLYTHACDSLNKSVAQDMSKEDKNLEELIKETDNVVQDPSSPAN